MIWSRAQIFVCTEAVDMRRSFDGPAHGKHPHDDVSGTLREVSGGDDTVGSPGFPG